MKRYLNIISFSFLLTFFSLYNPIKAAHIAAGEQIIFQVDKNLCDGVDSIRVVARFIRECMSGSGGVGSVKIDFTPSCGTLGAMDAFYEIAPEFTGTIEGMSFLGFDTLKNNPCVVNSRPCALEIYHYATDIIVLPPCDWKISWTLFARPETSKNIVNPGGTDMYIEGSYNNNRPCFSQGPCTFNRKNSSAYFTDNKPVVDFCVGKEYNYFINAHDPDGDILRYALLPALGDGGVPLQYVPGYNYKRPFPATGPILFDTINGVLTFTPSMQFEATIVFEVQEYRDSCWIDSNGDMQTELVLVGTSIRDTRFVFEDVCAEENVGFQNIPPDPDDDDPTPPAGQIQTGTLEYDCYAMYLPIALTYPVLCSSIEPNGTDFRLVSGDVHNPTKLFAIDAAYPIDSGYIEEDKLPIEPYFCQGDTTMNIMIKLYENLRPGNYKLFFKTGDDFNTLKTKCGVELDEYISIDVIVNNKPKLVEFDIKDISTCRPQDPAPIATIKGKNINLNKDNMLFSWNFEGTPIDDGPGTSDSTQSQVVDSMGTWYATADFNGCAYTDTFNVTIYKNIPLPEIPDFDLCLTDTFPVIDTMKYFLKSIVEDSGKVVSATEWWLYTDKNPKGEIVGYLDTLKTVVPGRYEFKATVDLCVLVEEFTINRRTNLPVDIGGDVQLCEGDTVRLASAFDFKSKSEHYNYEWFLDGELIEGEDQRELPPIFKTGEYSLKVSKPSGCFKIDTADIVVVDTLNKPQPICAHISFNEEILETFGWPAIAHAETYEVSEDNGMSWIPASGGDSTNSHITNKRVDIWVRAVNSEVGDTSECKYSLASMATKCPVEVTSPNVFTPNGDGINDYLMFNLIELFDGSALKIYNRWGKMIYESNSYKNDWDGEDYPPGTYFYILDINDPSHQTQKGTFTLIR